MVQGGLCADRPDLIEVFFPDDGPGLARKQALAKAICEQCPVELECRLVACGFYGRPMERFGVWGGLSEPERRKLRRSWTAIDTSWISERRRQAREESVALRVSLAVSETSVA